jgi:hypothetical protein
LKAPGSFAFLLIAQNRLYNPFRRVPVAVGIDGLRHFGVLG